MTYDHRGVDDEDPHVTADHTATGESTDHDSTMSTVDDQFRSLMEGLRTSLPGIQVLFAFLLITPLQSAFSDFTDVERAAFAIAFYSSGVASVLLIAPSVHQRVRAPDSGLTRRSKRHLIWATWLAISGSIVMAVAVSATVYLVSSLVFDSVVAAGAAAGIAALLGWAWFYLPMVTFRHESDVDADHRRSVRRG
ncbi:DUF6328 family protein [Ilumatobacter sp.]|uniref:DUF6328 family protein n=1 Tax=Ilumatobacter sp. TaxID=1967498 RepID=UPI003C4993EA